jgi:hypothetical protein
VHLVEQQRRMNAALTIATKRCDDARLRLAAARHSNDLSEAAAAHVSLQAALRSLRTCKVAYDHAHRTFLEELELLGRACAADSAVLLPGRDRSPAGAGGGAGTSARLLLPARRRPLTAIPWARLRARRLLHLVLAPGATGRRVR